MKAGGMILCRMPQVSNKKTVLGIISIDFSGRKTSNLYYEEIILALNVIIAVKLFLCQGPTFTTVLPELYNPTPQKAEIGIYDSPQNFTLSHLVPSDPVLSRSSTSDFYQVDMKQKCQRVGMRDF